MPLTSQRRQRREAAADHAVRIPTGDYTVNVIGEGCSLSSHTVERTFELRSTLESFVAEGCKGSATWDTSGSCSVRVE